MNKIKILHVYKSFNVYNGLIEILTILAQTMDLDRFELGVCVYEYDGNEAGRRFEKLGGEIYSLNLRRGLNTRHRELLDLVSFFKQHRPDVVQTHALKANLYGVIAARLAKVPVVIGTEMTLKDTAPTRFGRFRDRLVQPMVSRILQQCDRFVVTSEFIRQEWCGNTPSDKVRVVYPPFNLVKLNTALQNGPPTRIPDGKIRWCYAGRLSEEKGVTPLLDGMSLAIRRNPRISLTLVGTGPLEDELRKRAAAMDIGEAIRFTGYQENTFDILKEMDGFVLASRSEGCPIVVLEAMALGLPVVATAVGGTPELVRQGKTGILVPPNNPEKLAQAVIELTDNPEQARAFGIAGRKLAFNELHPARFTDSLQQLYLQLVDAKAHRSVEMAMETGQA